jgi:biopolymer transport protein ExbD
MNFRKKLRVREEAGFDLTAMVDITLLLLWSKMHLVPLGNNKDGMLWSEQMIELLGI